MSQKNSLNALMFGSDDDSLYLGPARTSLTGVTGLSSPIPDGLEDKGWINPDGMGFELSDSIEKLRGHQGNAVVKSFMSESDTTFTATLMESLLQTLLDYLSATAERVTDNGKTIAKISAPSSRKVTYLTGMVDLFETTESQSQWRILFPSLALGERQGLPFKNNELTAYNYTLEVLGGFIIYTNTESLIPVEGGAGASMMAELPGTVLNPAV